MAGKRHCGITGIHDTIGYWDYKKGHWDITKLCYNDKISQCLDSSGHNYVTVWNWCYNTVALRLALRELFNHNIILMM